MQLLFTPVSITALIDTEDACFTLNGISPIAKGDLKWRDALLFTGTVNSNEFRQISPETVRKGMAKHIQRSDLL